MKSLLLIVALLMTATSASVSHAKAKKDKPAVINREVAQTMSEENRYGDSKEIIAAFETRAETGDKESLAMMNDYIQRLLKIYVRTDDLVKKFDKDLAAGENPMDTRNYKNIQTYYALHKRLTSRITNFHRYLSDIAYNKALPNTDAKKQAAKAALAAFHDKLKNMSAVEKVAYQEIFTRVSGNLAAIARQRYSHLETGANQDNVAKELRAALMNTPKIQETLNSADYKNGMIAETMQAKESKNLPEVGGTLDKEFDEMRSKIELADDDKGRRPQSSGIRPGTDDMGWVTGNSFPAGVWAFTYDDGPNAANTKVIMDTFNANNVKATFFWLSQITSQPGMASTIAAVKASGHEMASHSHTHANLPTLGADGLQREIDNAQVLHTKAFGYAPKFFRCPYGACGGNTSAIRQRIANNNMVMAFWNVDSLDWQDHNPSSVIARIKSQMTQRGRGIVLMHDIHASTATATTMMIPDLVKNGLNGQPIQFVTMSKAIE